MSNAFRPLEPKSLWGLSRLRTGKHPGGVNLVVVHPPRIGGCSCRTVQLGHVQGWYIQCLQMSTVHLQMLTVRPQMQTVVVPYQLIVCHPRLSCLSSPSMSSSLSSSNFNHHLFHCIFQNSILLKILIFHIHHMPTKPPPHVLCYVFKTFRCQSFNLLQVVQFLLWLLGVCPSALSTVGPSSRGKSSGSHSMHC